MNKQGGYEGKSILGKGEKCRGPHGSLSNETGGAALEQKMESSKLDHVGESYMVSKILEILKYW